MTPSPHGGSPLSPADFQRLLHLGRRLPPGWLCSARRRRLLFLGLAAPGFTAVFATPLHRNLALLGLGLALFLGALVFRRRTEPLFARAERAALWPPPPPLRAKDTPPHA